MPKERVRLTTTKERREKQKQNYLDGKARRLHSHTPAMNVAHKENEQGESPTNRKAFGRCWPILERYVEDFSSTQLGSADSTRISTKEAEAHQPRSPQA